MNMFELMGAPFVECLVLVAIHTYLGIHVLKRRVIFVDLALAQIAALGTTVGFLFGIMPDTTGALLFSMAFTFIGAAVFTVTRFRHERVPQEAIIGLSYAVSCAVAILVIEKTRGAEHLKDILVGNLLWATWADVLLAAVVYLVIGGIHFLCRKQFLQISDDPEKALALGLRVRLWDFLFYLTFGVVITVSTRVAGVLLVFVFLVAPAILAFSLTQRVGLQLLIGWGTGTLVTTVGLYLSWYMDLPSGPAVIAFYGVALALAGVVIYLVRAEDRKRAWRSFAAGLGVVALLGLGVWAAGRWIADSRIAVSDEARQVEEDINRDESDAAARHEIEADEQGRVLLERVGRFVDAGRISDYRKLPGPEERMAYVRKALAADRRQGLESLLVAFADDDLGLFYKEECSELLHQALGRRFRYNPEAPWAENTEAMERLGKYIQGLPRPGKTTGKK
ncbi:MAG: metal ABC transporter permease [Acidobacteria bacterium]|nr:metal ABC transporter permease [Acidobacteriota bacterium]